MRMNKLEVKTDEVVLKDNEEWLHFANPHRIVTAARLEDVRPALHEIESSIESNNWHAAGFLSYESGSAFDPALETKLIAGFPYLWFGLYPKPHIIELPTPGPPNEILNWQTTIDCETYNSAIATIRSYIAEGRTYQVNYTMRLQAD